MLEQNAGGENEEVLNRRAVGHGLEVSFRVIPFGHQ